MEGYFVNLNVYYTVNPSPGRNRPAFLRLLQNFLLLALLAGNIPGRAQEYRFYYGRVIDAATGRGMTGVNLSVEKTRYGTVSGRKGEFSFFTDSVPAILVVSYVGYETKRVLLDSTSYSLALYLKKTPAQLPEVEIKANATEPFFRDLKYAVLDYEIDSGMVYLIVYRDNRSQAELICKNLFGDTVAVSRTMTFRPVRLHRDCLGVMHVLSADSGYQVFRSGYSLEMIYPVNLKKFDDVLKNCVAATSSTLFFRKVTDRGLGVEYYGVDRKTLLRKSFSRVSDEKKLKMLRRNGEDAMLLGRSVQPDNREDFVTWNYVHKILYRPVKSSLYRVGGFLCVFNTPEKQAEFYDTTGNFAYKLALQVDLAGEGRWTSDIYTDETDGRVFTTFLRNGTCLVYEISPDDGSLRLRRSLTHIFPQRIRIYNGWVYYLYDVRGDPDNKMLYRQRL